jgi:hypothetical protein
VCTAWLAAEKWEWGRARDGGTTVEAEGLRYAMCGAAIAFLCALAWLPSWTWVPLMGLAWALGIAADIAEGGLPDVIALARRGAAVLLTFQYVCLAWIFFRAPTFDDALAVLTQIGRGELDHANLGPLVTTALAVGFLCHFWADGSFAWLSKRFMKLSSVANGWIAQGLLLALAALVLRELGHAKIVPFIYFQF